ncbi:MAG: UMP kinase [Alphaproteobacteria bacterium]|jgi:uridylate kinase|nr:UMP kinase [Alphaproteobacteria bacterium]MCV6599762.1 UMP kinase [Alphaproteobacteria bacterium]
MPTKKKERILLKLSGEFLMGDRDYGVDPKTVARIAGEIKLAHKKGFEICIVIGGGNIFRGISASAKGMERTSADYMGMLATIMNCVAMQNALEKIQVPTLLQSSMQVGDVCEPFIKRKAIREINRGTVVIFAGGLGVPFFTTDTTAAVRASEMECNLVLKATKVDGVYDKDPAINKNAKRFDKMTYHDILSKELKVMDLSAITLLKENNIPLKVFSLEKKGNMEKVLNNKGLFTLVK